MADAIQFKITGFADEISPDLSLQLSTFNQLKLHAIDVRSVDGKNVLSLTDDELKHVAEATANAGLGIQAVGSPVNKVWLTPENRQTEFAKLKRAAHVAHILGVERVRIFSPEVASDEHESKTDEVLNWMREQIAFAADQGVTLLHENDAKFWGAHPANAKIMFAELGSPHFRAAFDFANTVLIGYRPMQDWFPWILPFVDTLHIKDAVEADHKVVPAGEGDGQLEETFRYMLSQNWSGPLTLEPHLQAAGPLGGFSGPQLFEVAAVALRKILLNVGVAA